MTSELVDEDESTHVPDDAGAVARPAHDDVVGLGGGQTGDGLGVAVQGALQHSLALLGHVLPHVHHLQSE